MLANLLKEKASSQAFPAWLTFFRIILGLILVAKGISFLYDSTSLETMVHNNGWDMFNSNAQTMAAIITYANLLGGVFIATGFITRWASVVQIPILIGAVIYNMQEGISFSNPELLLSGITLILLIVFVVKGSGPISADEFFRSYTFAGQEKGHTKKFFQ
jgi:putative oxidoreductase